MSDTEPIALKLGPEFIGAEVLRRLAWGRHSGTLEWIRGERRLTLGFLKGRPEYKVSGGESPGTSREDVRSALYRFALAASGRCLFRPHEHRVKASLQIDTIGEALKAILRHTPEQYLRVVWQARGASILEPTTFFAKLCTAIVSLGAPALRQPPTNIQLGALVVGAPVLTQRAWLAVLLLGGLRPVGPPIWSERIESHRFSTLLLKLFKARLSGHLAIEHEGRAKHLRFAKGQLISAASNIEAELLGNLLRQGRPEEAQRIDEAIAIAVEHSRAIGWGLTQTGLLNEIELNGWLQRQARDRVFDLFGWSQGSARFYADPRTEESKPSCRIPILDLLRTAAETRGGNVPHDANQTLGELFLRKERLLLVSSPGEDVTRELQPAERHLLEHLHESPVPEDLLADLEATSPDLDHALRTLSVFGEMGLITFTPQPPSNPDFFETSVDEPPEEPADPPDLRDRVPPASAPMATATVAPARLTTADLFDDPDDEPLAVPIPPAPLRGREPPPGAPVVPDTGSSGLEEYQLRQSLERDGRILMREGDPAGAEIKFQELADLQAKPTTALAYLALAMLLQGGPEATARAQELSGRAFENDQDNALSHAVLSRVFKATGRQAKAQMHLELATRLSQKNAEWSAQVKEALWVGARDMTGGPTVRRAPKAQSGLAVGGIAVATIVCLFIAANLLRFGETEYFYRPVDVFFWIRRVILLGAGIAGAAIWRRVSLPGVLLDMGWSWKDKWVVVGLAWGICLGALSPAQRVDTGVLALTLLTLVHVFCEEVFFRGFVTRVLLDLLPDWRGAVMLSGVIFGFYHVTFYSFWYETAVASRFYWAAAIALLAGAPYAWLYYKTRSLLAPLICHTATNLTMMWLSL